MYPSKFPLHRLFFTGGNLRWRISERRSSPSLGNTEQDYSEHPQEFPLRVIAAFRFQSSD